MVCRMIMIGFETNADTRGVISVFESETLSLHTTRSWDFMGLTLDYNKGTPLQLAYGDDVIVGRFDSGAISKHHVISFSAQPSFCVKNCYAIRVTLLISAELSIRQICYIFTPISTK